MIIIEIKCDKEREMRMFRIASYFLSARVYFLSLSLETYRLSRLIN